MAIVKVENKTYTVEPLHQWDQNQVLEIRGLSLAKVPEIHFANTAMDRAVVRQATMDVAGVITADVPNTLLQKPYKITAYLCAHEGDTFETQYKVEIPVKARPRPVDYTFEDDAGEIYSFNTLENMVYDAVHELQVIAQSAQDSAAASAGSAAASAGSAAAAEAAAVASAAAAEASANAAAEEVKNAILKSEITEIVKVTELPESPAANVLYVIV